MEKRIGTLSSHDLISWTENALYVIGKEITHYQRDRNMESLYEMELGAEALLGIVKELKKRATNEL
jgi:hypothetical protein